MCCALPQKTLARMLLVGSKKIMLPSYGDYKNSKIFRSGWLNNE